MKKHTALVAITSVIVMTTTGCNRNHEYDTVLKETYIHEYGVPVTKSDWKEQGEEGKVVKQQKDGVTVTQSYSKGVLSGETTFSFPNSSTIQRTETYDAGELVAKRVNYASGVPMYEETYDHGMLSLLTKWHEDGTPSATESYEAFRLVKGEYRTPLNVTESEVHDGFGMRITRSNEGDLLSKDTIEEGMMSERITYFANGDPSTITPYHEDKIHGTRLTYLQGGLPHTAEEWTHGKQEGTTVVYQNGEKFAEIPYISGKKEGIEMRFRDGSDVAEEITWRGDIQHGARTLYVDGEAKTEWYHQGEVVSRTAYERMNLPVR